MFNYIKFSAVLIVVAIFLSGCLISEKMRWLDNETGRIFFDKETENKIEQVGSSTQKAIDFVKKIELSKEQKDKIDKFLEDNNLNRYGDAIGTMYAGGTPLFDEIKNESIDRFDYIQNKHPEIWEKIKGNF